MQVSRIVLELRNGWCVVLSDNDIISREINSKELYALASIKSD